MPPSRGTTHHDIMENRTAQSFFEAHYPMAIPAERQTLPALEDYLSDRYGLASIRRKYFTRILADILWTSDEGARFMLDSCQSDELKLMALSSRLAVQRPESVDTSFRSADRGWHAFTGNKRWHELIRTGYRRRDEGVINEHASISNFPHGRSNIPQKMESDHRVNYFLWSLWEGFTPDEKAQLPHLEFAHGDEGPRHSALSCRFVQYLLAAGHLLDSCVAYVEAQDPRYWTGKTLPHAISAEHVDIVNYHLHQAAFAARERHLRVETLRAELIKNAVLNMALNETDGIEKVEKEAKCRIPRNLSSVLGLSGSTPYAAGNAFDIQHALAEDFSIEKTAIPDDLMGIAECLAKDYVQERQPHSEEGIKGFMALHKSIRSHGFHAALLLHDFLNQVDVPRQVKGDTTGKVSAYEGIKEFFVGNRELTLSHLKFYQNRYPALVYGYTDGHPLAVGIDSYYDARALRRSVTFRFFHECWRMDSATIACLVQQFPPERLLYASPFQMPGAQVAYRTRSTVS